MHGRGPVAQRGRDPDQLVPLFLEQCHIGRAVDDQCRNFDRRQRLTGSIVALEHVVILQGGDLAGPLTGPRVPPGVYTVKVTSGSWSESQTFRVMTDPRYPQVTDAEVDIVNGAASYVVEFDKDGLQTVRVDLETGKALKVAAEADDADDTLATVHRDDEDEDDDEEGDDD